MTRKWKALLCCLMIACSGFSQDSSANKNVMLSGAESYPRYIVLQGDTLCVITVPQMRHICETYLKLDECDTIATPLIAERDARVSIDQRTDSVIHGYQSLVKNDEAIFDGYRKQQALDADQMATMRKQAKLAKVKSKLLGWGIGVPLTTGVGVAGFVIGAFLKPKL